MSVAAVKALIEAERELVKSQDEVRRLKRRVNELIEMLDDNCGCLYPTKEDLIREIEEVY